MDLDLLRVLSLVALLEHSLVKVQASWLVLVSVPCLVHWLVAELGKLSDQTDRMYANQAQSKNLLPLNETISWNNPDSGHSGTITGSEGL